MQTHGVSEIMIGRLLLRVYQSWVTPELRLLLMGLKRFTRLDSDIMFPGHGMTYYYRPRRQVEKALNEALIQWR